MKMNTEKICEMVGKYTPEILTVWPTIHMMEARHIIYDRRLSALEKAYVDTNKALEEYRRGATRRTRSNNWLKLHRQPMRRGKENRDLKY